MVNLSKIPPETKRHVWALIKEHAPDLAELLTSADMQQHQASFDAGVLVYRDDLPWQALEIINR